MKKLLIILGSAMLCYSCAPKPYAPQNKVYGEQAGKFAKIIAAPPKDSVYADSLKVPVRPVFTTNFGMRKPNMVIIHYTAQNSCDKTLETFTTPAREVSAHYVICKDGTLHHMLNDYLRAWHAGVGKWGNNSDINSSSVGIEIDNNGTEAFTTAQLNTLNGVLAYLKRSYNIPVANFIGHSDVAPGRKIDPGVLFPWKALAENGYGHWYSDTTGLNIPADFNAPHALRIIGYDISNLPAAMQAFRSHFIAVTTTGELSLPEKKILYSLLRKYL
ncbi:MAG: N-acetylmuramoyl-L-alanine amidase [Ferruginibacter sp.]